MDSQRIFPILLISVVLVITSCVPTPFGGNPPTATVVAPLTQVSSSGTVVVNGVQYSTRNTLVYIEGAPAQLQDLKPGMKVRLRGVDDGTTGTAYSIHFDDDLEGEVAVTNLTTGQAQGTMVIMGQTILISEETKFDSEVVGIDSLEQISPGMICEVSGFNVSEGTISATFIGVEALDKTSYQQFVPEGTHLKGIVSRLDTTASTFFIGNQRVTYSSATFVDPALSNDVFVIINSLDGLDANGVLIASGVDILTDSGLGRPGADGAVFETRGRVTASLIGDTFAVNGQTVRLAPNVRLFGMQRTDIVLGTYIGVSGFFDANGVVVATEVAGLNAFFNSLFFGAVTAIEVTGPNTGRVTVGVKEYIVDQDTVITSGILPDGNSGKSESTLDLQSLQVNNFVMIKHYTNAAGEMVATSLMRINILLLGF